MHKNGLIYKYWCFPGGSDDKKLPAVQETQVWWLRNKKAYDKIWIYIFLWKQSEKVEQINGNLDKYILYILMVSNGKGFRVSSENKCSVKLVGSSHFSGGN